MPRTADPKNKSGLSRRGFIKGVGAAAVTAEVLANRPLHASPPPADAKGTPGEMVSGEVNIVLTINGKERSVAVEPRTTLLSALRDRLEPAITGPKLVCNAGTCGACTVIVDGKTYYGCNILAVDVIGKKITTVEGIGTPEKLSPVQAAFCEKDGMMCGYCTSGFVTAVTNFLEKNPDPTLEQLKVGIKGNFCRCGTYPHIFEAAFAAAKVMKKA